ncbi:MAG: prephenate dehydrogenase [Coraliomargarita sp.]
MFAQITILGPGLLGASLAMALKARGLCDRVVSWSRRPETRAKCAATDWCDAVFDCPEAAVRGSQLVVICTPVQTIVPLLEQIASSLEPDTLITDVGSTKSLICRESRGVVPETCEFIGSHPMAGSEQTGMEFAHPELFQDAACILTPLEHSSAAATEKLTRFWQALGMLVKTTSPEQHDEIVAHVSHLPHLLASTLCSYLATQDANWANLSGGGLRDSTRVAAGDPTLWRQILEQNRDEALRAIAGFEDELHRLKTALLNNDSLSIQTLLERGKDYRDRLRP